MSEDQNGQRGLEPETEVVADASGDPIDVEETRASQPPAAGTDSQAEKTARHLSDSLIGETVTLNSSGENVIGNFRLNRRLGSGAFGVVYAADDLRLDRQVALKVPMVVKGEGAVDYYKRVFHEGRAAAALDHPNIVSIYDVAERNGQPFIVSQLIEGPSLYDRNTSGRMDQREAAELMLLICRALAYAHKKGIVHRDLKPGNILLDEAGVPHVNDFGIAKYETVEETISTDTNSVIGTPAYMSPEQAAGRSRDADRRSDLYSLGVILYELLTGERPFRGSARMLLHQVVHDEPQRPRQLVGSIHRDLETICLKCLEKDPARRYQDCDEMADELQRFLAGDAIHARPVSQIEYAWRKCRRYPVATGLGIAFVLSLVLGLAGVTWQWQRAETNRQREQIARQQAEQTGEQLAREVDYSNRLLYGARIGLASASVASGDYQQARRHLTFPDGAVEDFRDIEYEILNHYVDRYESLLQHFEQVTDVAISDDESIIAACGLRTLLIWDVESGQVIFRAREKGKQLRCVTFAPGSDLVAWSGQSGRISFRHTASTGNSPPTLLHDGGVHAIAFNSDGTALLSAGQDGRIIVWSLQTFEPIHVIDDHRGPVRDAAFADDHRILSGGQDRRVRITDLESEASVVLASTTSQIMAVAAGNQAKQFAAATESSKLIVGEIENPTAAESLHFSGGYIVDLQFLDDPQLLIASSFFGNVRIWNLPDLRAARTLRCLKGFGKFSVAKKSNRLIVGAGDGSIEAIRIDATPLDEIVVDCRTLSDARLVDDGRAVVVCPDSGPARILRRESGRYLRSIPDPADPAVPDAMSKLNLLGVDESPDGERLAFGTDTGQVLIWQVDDAKLRLHGTPDDRAISAVRFADDASTVISGGEDGAVRVWDLNRADESREVARHGGVIRDLAKSPDGKWLAVAAADGAASLIDLQDWQQAQRIETEQPLYAVAWSDDSHWLAVGDAKGAVTIYASDLTGEPQTLLGHAGPVTCLLFTPSGNTILSGGNDDWIRFWDLETEQAKMLGGVHNRNLQSISLDPGGGIMISADVGGKVRFWHVGKP